MPQYTDHTPTHQVRWISNFEIFVVREVLNVVVAQFFALKSNQQTSPGRPSRIKKIISIKPTIDTRTTATLGIAKTTVSIVYTDIDFSVCYAYGRRRCHL